MKKLLHYFLICGFILISLQACENDDLCEDTLCTINEVCLDGVCIDTTCYVCGRFVGDAEFILQDSTGLIDTIYNFQNLVIEINKTSVENEYEILLNPVYQESQLLIGNYSNYTLNIPNQVSPSPIGLFFVEGNIQYDSTYHSIFGNLEFNSTIISTLSFESFRQ
jgi:hypothetical protein